MNELIKIMANDMGISSYTNESNESYSYRVIYSALGLWCLKSSYSKKECINNGISKNAQSMLLHNLLEHYVKMCPYSKHLLLGFSNRDIAVFIRNVYEQTGYLLTLENNFNILNNGGETVTFSNTDYLYLGWPSTNYSINGLGIHCKNKGKEVKLRDFLVRDSLTPEEYIKVNYDECDFEERDINTDELEFFNPYYYGNISSSWYGRIKSNKTVARKHNVGTYYRVIKRQNGTLLFADEIKNDEKTALTGAEFRRLYVALKKYYDNPMQMLICRIDDEYSHVRILGQLPNREYFYLLMNSWPKNSFFDRNNFIIRNKLIEQTAEVLKSIGFTTRNGEFYG